MQTFSDILALLNSPAITVGSYPASWAELLGAVLGIAMVVCNIKQIHWAWPLAFVSSVLYFFVFWDFKLFAEASLQIFFAVLALWGWWQWLRGVQSDGQNAGQAIVVQTLSSRNAIQLITVSAVLWLAIGLFLKNFTVSDVPWWDAFPTALSLVATYLLGRKYIENWPTWVVVNLVSIALFAYKGLWLTVGLYFVFAVMAVIGWQSWRKQLILPNQ